MSINQIFSDTLDPAQVNLSDRFTQSSAFFIYTPFLAEREIEFTIDCFLQVYLDQLTRNIPLGRIAETAVLLNRCDTETVQPIPQEFLDTNLEMALLFLPSEAVYLEAFAIAPDVSLTSLNEQLQEINTRLEADAARDTAEIINELAQNAALTGLGATLGTALVPVSAGTSAAIPIAVASALAAGNEAITALPGF